MGLLYERETATSTAPVATGAHGAAPSIGVVVPPPPLPPSPGDLNAAGKPWTIRGPDAMVLSYGYYDPFPGAPPQGPLVNMNALKFPDGQNVSLNAVRDNLGNPFLGITNPFSPDRLLACYRYLYSDENAIATARLSQQIMDANGFVAYRAWDSNGNPIPYVDVGDYWSVADGSLKRVSSSGEFSPPEIQAADPWVHDVFFPFSTIIVDWKFDEQGLRGSVNLWTRIVQLEYIKGMNAEKCAEVRVVDSIETGFFGSIKGFAQGFAAGGFVGAIVGAVVGGVTGHIAGWQDASGQILEDQVGLSNGKFLKGPAPSDATNTSGSGAGTSTNNGRDWWETIIAFLKGL